MPHPFPNLNLHFNPDPVTPFPNKPATHGHSIKPTRPAAHGPIAYLAKNRPHPLLALNCSSGRHKTSARPELQFRASLVTLTNPLHSADKPRYPMHFVHFPGQGHGRRSSSNRRCRWAGMLSRATATGLIPSDTAEK